MLKRQNEIFVAMFALSDMLANILAFFLAYYFKFYYPIFGAAEWIPPILNYLFLLAIELPLWFFAYRRAGLYRSNRSIHPAEEFYLIIKGNFWGLFILGSIFFFYRQHTYSRQMVAFFCCLNIIICFVARYFLRKVFLVLRRQGYNLRNLLIIGAGDLGVTIVNRIEEHSGLGYKIIGYLDDDPQKWGQVLAGAPVLGALSNMVAIIEEQKIEEVIFALPLSAHEITLEYVRKAIQVGSRVGIVPDYLSLIAHRAAIEELDGIPLIGLQNVPLTGFWNRLLKRTFDLVAAIIITIVISPLLIIIAILVKLTSAGPLLFVQERVGLNNCHFNMYKFRTMNVGAEQKTGPVWAKKDDPRTTLIGKFLRRTSLDELPQLLNVIRGDMSLVGPRPERPFFVKQFKEEFTHYMLRHQVKEGITGWAQVNGWRGNTSMEKRVEFDIYYIENWSFFLDLKIIWLTLWKGFVNKNAY